MGCLSIRQELCQCRNSGATMQKAPRHLRSLIWMEPSWGVFKPPELGRVMRKKEGPGSRSYSRCVSSHCGDGSLWYPITETCPQLRFMCTQYAPKWFCLLAAALGDSNSLCGLISVLSSCNPGGSAFHGFSCVTSKEPFTFEKPSQQLLSSQNPAPSNRKGPLPEHTGTFLECTLF